MREKMTDALVSILIPAYNVDTWIGESISSAINQTWPRKEIIVINDGSTDSTGEAIRAWKSPIVKVVTQENQGAARSRNRALSLAQGDYIQWLDGDDVLAPDKITRQMKAAERESTRTLFSSRFGLFYTSPSRASFAPGPLWKDLSPVAWITEKFANNTWMNPAVWLVSRELSDTAGPWNPDLSLDDDGEYFCRIVAASDSVRFVPEACSYYRQWNPSSLSRSINVKAQRSLLTSLKLSIGYLRDLEDSETTRAAARSYLQVWMGYFYSEQAELLEELQALARELGGELHPPALSLKYRCIRHLFGWGAAKKAARMVASSKLAANIQVDRLRGLAS
jgi:glycosyltransferase involved in cell wall biosynthesis